jgi:hypothetical protein
MAKYPKWNPLGWLRTLRWWGVTYGSVKLVRGPLGLLLRTPPLSVWVFAAGVAVGAYFVWVYVPCP